VDHRRRAVRRSKTDQEGLGRRVGIPRRDIACPMTALGAWLEAAGISEGAVFRRVFNRRAQRVGDQRLAARNVASVVKAAAAKLGFDPATFGGVPPPSVGGFFVHDVAVAYAACASP
jgi:hypothetical protein